MVVLPFYILCDIKVQIIQENKSKIFISIADTCIFKMTIDKIPLIRNIT